MTKVKQDFSSVLWCFYPFLWDLVFLAMHNSLELVYGKYICKASYNTVQNVFMQLPNCWLLRSKVALRTDL